MEEHFLRECKLHSSWWYSICQNYLQLNTILNINHPVRLSEVVTDVTRDTWHVTRTVMMSAAHLARVIQAPWGVTWRLYSPATAGQLRVSRGLRRVSLSDLSFPPVISRPAKTRMQIIFRKQPPTLQAGKIFCNATLVLKIKGVTAAQYDLFILNKLQRNFRILHWINKKEVFIDWD